MVKKNYIVCIVQARSASSRFPKKIFQKINKEMILEILIKRLKKSEEISRIIIATTKNKSDDEIIKICKKLNVSYFRGEENNVLKRYYDAAVKFKANTIVRITSDCPLSDPYLIDKIIRYHQKLNSDYTSNTLKPTFPDGLDVEVFSFNQLKLAQSKSKNIYEREHVTPLIKNNDQILRSNYENKNDYSKSRWTIDEKDDLLFLDTILKKLKYNFLVDWKKVIKTEKKYSYLKNINSKFQRNEGSKMNNNLKRWKYAKTKIVSGNSLLSKRPIIFAPDIWPTYYSKAKGISVWDLENKKYDDFSLMGIGTNTLGYANSEIDNKVINAIKKSNMSTLNNYDEVLLAERLLELHSWAGKVKFARSGAEANTIALRIARCNTNKQNVAICGYHGWHDWYLSSNISQRNKLDKHLLQGLNVKGVNRNLINTCFPFDYNSIDQLENLIKYKKIGIIFMEVSRNLNPNKNFFKKIQNLAKKNKIILIFDECTSGFRETYGGLHLKYNIIPDICVFGKSLGNGYPITAIVGKDKIMNEASDSFISSTFWSDRSGPVAALETLKLMKKLKSWSYISKLGKKVKKQWLKLAKKNNLELKVYGLDSMPSFEIKSDKFLKYKTFITQEMLKKNMLATNSIYISTKHNSYNLKKYFTNLDYIFKKINLFEKNKLNIDAFLSTKISQSNFQRLN